MVQLQGKLFCHWCCSLTCFIVMCTLFIDRYCKVSSFGEKKALKIAREVPKTFLQHNRRQLSRIYPAGGRIDSSNYDPMILWTVGSQLGTVCLFQLPSSYLLFISSAKNWLDFGCDMHSDLVPRILCLIHLFAFIHSFIKRILFTCR